MKFVPQPASFHGPPLELGRRITGCLLELGFKAYGTAAVASVALSDAETVGGKLYDAATAVPNLMERFRQARYVFDHAEEIQAALEYVHDHAPDSQQLDAAVHRTQEALNGIQSVFAEISQAKEALADLSVTEAFEHLGRAWTAMPDLASISHLADVAQNVTPVLRYLTNLDIDFAALFQGMLSVADNFALDEIVSTLGVMAVAFGTAFALGLGAGFWARRGRPGFLMRTLQGWGAHLFPDWYARHLEGALGWRLFVIARERIQRDIVADPQKALGPEAHQALERHFERRLRERLDAGSSHGVA